MFPLYVILKKTFLINYGMNLNDEPLKEEQAAASFYNIL